jgi:hypothetical protein
VELRGGGKKRKRVKIKNEEGVRRKTVYVKPKI